MQTAAAKFTLMHGLCAISPSPPPPDAALAEYARRLPLEFTLQRSMISLSRALREESFFVFEFTIMPARAIAKLLLMLPPRARRVTAD